MERILIRSFKKQRPRVLLGEKEGVVILGKKGLLKRPFTKDSDMLIVIALSEGYGAKATGLLLGRDSEDVEKRVRGLRKSGELKKIHKRLIESNGVYAYRYKNRKREKGA